MSPGKLAAQCCHASIAFITSQLRDNQNVTEFAFGRIDDPDEAVVAGYDVELYFDKETYEDWICGIFTKTICEAKNKNQLLKAVEIARGLGLKEDEDYFLIKDACHTELEPEEIDENGIGRTLTCIGFRPLHDEVAHAISKKFQLYK